MPLPTAGNTHMHTCTHTGTHSLSVKNVEDRKRVTLKRVWDQLQEEEPPPWGMETRGLRGSESPGQHTKNQPGDQNPHQILLSFSSTPLSLPLFTPNWKGHGFPGHSDRKQKSQGVRAGKLPNLFEPL